ncbi:hypothetical protein C8Q76DRAFT_840002 [Earliella scabrosa]|nr:hypothetical protein C8Q76DRAFT_840002 [Earliella scabrosa]
MPKIKTNPFSKLKNAHDMVEATISSRMLTAVNSHNLAPGLKMALSENAPDPVLVDPSSQRIDGALYPKARTPRTAAPIGAIRAFPLNSRPSSTRSTTRRTRWKLTP